MRDVELYATILGLTPPWKVVSVDVDIPGEQVTVKVEAGPGPFPCPECQTLSPGYDRRPRRWRHLDTLQLRTWIEADIPRVQCARHGIKQIAIPWAEPGSQFTQLFERLAIDFLRECSVTGAAALLRITWDEAWGIKSRAVKRGLARRTAELIPYVGVDEKAITKGHRYLTVVADLQRSRVLFVNEDRKADSLDAFWPTCTQAQRDSITAVAMDMWEPYVHSVTSHLPDGAGKIVFDKFVRRAKPAPMGGGETPRKLGIRAQWAKVPCGQRLTSRLQASLAW
jgi:transposase